MPIVDNQDVLRTFTAAGACIELIRDIGAIPPAGPIVVPLDLWTVRMQCTTDGKDPGHCWTVHIPATSFGESIDTVAYLEGKPVSMSYETPEPAWAVFDDACLEMLRMDSCRQKPLSFPGLRALRIRLAAAVRCLRDGAYTPPDISDISKSDATAVLELRSVWTPWR